MKKSLELNGSYYLTTPFEHISNMTIEFYINFLDFNNNICLLGKGLNTSDNNDEINITILKNKDVYVDIGGSNSYLQFNYPFVENTWYHMAVVKSENTGNLKAYINGELSSNKSIVSITNENPLVIGANRVGTTCSCLIDEFKIWNVSKEQQEIKENINKKLIGNESNLILYLDFNNSNNGDMSVLDLSINNRNIVSSNSIIVSNNTPPINEYIIKYLLQSKLNNKIYTINNNVLTDLNKTTYDENLFFNSGFTSFPILNEVDLNTLGEFKLLKYIDDLTQIISTLNLSGNYKQPIYKLIPNSNLLTYTDDTSVTKAFTSGETTETFKPIDKLSNEYEIYSYK